MSTGPQCAAQTTQLAALLDTNSHTKKGPVSQRQASIQLDRESDAHVIHTFDPMQDPFTNMQIVPSLPQFMTGHISMSFGKVNEATIPFLVLAFSSLILGYMVLQYKRMVGVGMVRRKHIWAGLRLPLLSAHADKLGRVQDHCIQVGE
jgi:hypothetical protein